MSHFKSRLWFWEAFQRGTNQKVAVFSFYGDKSSDKHKQRKYFGGIEENLRLVRAEYGADWSLRLYYDLAQSDELMDRLCELACSNSHLDLCNVRQLPGNPVRDASHLHPSIWRFLPSLDPQVSVFLSRDLDSRITAREVAVVTEWLQSDRPLHAMRDHPSHRAAVMAGAWGATRSGQDICAPHDGRRGAGGRGAGLLGQLHQERRGQELRPQLRAW